MIPIYMQEAAKAHQMDLLKEAEQWRLLMQVRASQPSLSDRLLERLGGLLIKAGERLKGHPISRQVEHSTRPSTNWSYRHRMF